MKAFLRTLINLHLFFGPLRTKLLGTDVGSKANETVHGG